MGEAPIVNRNTYMCRYGIRKSYVDAGTRTHGTNARTRTKHALTHPSDSGISHMKSEMRGGPHYINP